MTLAEICDAAMTRSDNTAGNLLLAAIGGPAGLTAFARGLGDQVTRLDRDEPSLNQALPDDPRDTTTPNAMASNLQTLILGTTALSAASREQLTAWLIANKTGDTRLRAGFAKDWRVGDKTGVGDRGTNNHVAVVWPPVGAPIVIAVYLTGASVPAAQQNAIIASVARAIAARTSG
jgi:beta-lactamase class A